ncbi:MAG: hypothetical protein JXR83_21960 [Deltaproteobacteria bacterium]|nr:hypothetical protein [Deltaproteobacteria bacterium]
MAELEKLLKQLHSAERKEDLDRLDRIREQIVSEHAEAREATEARYRLGLSRLLRHRDLQTAEQLFLEAARGDDPLFAPMARVSYALLLHAQKKDQKALFELRKVVGSRKPTPQSAIALSFIVTILRDIEAKPDEIQRAQAQQIEHLRTLLAECQETEARAPLLLQLGLALWDHGDRAAAKRTLQEVLDLGAAAAPAVLAEVKSVLAGL